MSLHDDLLEHAQALATQDPRRPRQANLRRSISAAYYALFHRLTSEAAGLYATGADLRARIGRTFNHGEMRKVSQSIARGDRPKVLQPPTGRYTPPPDLRIVAETFTNLQEARHEADYEVTRTFRRHEALDYVRRAQAAFNAWDRIRRTDDASLYLACFLLWKRWDEEPR